MTVTRHICPLCEATCGLEITVEGDRVIAVSRAQSMRSQALA